MFFKIVLVEICMVKKKKINLFLKDIYMSRENWYKIDKKENFVILDYEINLLDCN